MNLILNSYQKSVHLCKNLGLWDIDNGLILRGILQHCMPPPSMEHLLVLITILQHCAVNSSWAPQDKVQEIHRKLKSSRKEQFFSDESVPNWRTQFPVFYGIKRCSEQAWNTPTRAKAICYFVETIHKQLGQDHSQDLFYRDVYCLRDYLIINKSKQLRVTPKGKLDGNYEQKKHIYSEIRQGRQIGSKDKISETFVPFWSTVPHIKFQWSPPLSDDKQPPFDVSNANDTHPFYPSDALKNNEQQQDIQFVQPRWLRNNVRSLADPQQLSWSIIFKYWAILLKQNKKSLFVLSYLTLLTGIRKRRWRNYLTNKPSDLTEHNLRLRHDEENSLLEYRVERGATEFDESISGHREISIRLPKELTLDDTELLDALNEETSTRAFRLKNPGPTPHLRNMALSGHNLLSHCQSEIESFILTGQIPIEFQARAAYLSINNERINEILNQRATNILRLAKQYQPQNEALHQAIQVEFAVDAIPNNQLGSQPGQEKWLRPNTNLKINRKSTTDMKVQLLNELELYTYWMDAYCCASRPKGTETVRLNTPDLIFHKDKDSSEYKESKILLKPNTYKQQEMEVKKARETLLRHCKKFSITLSIKGCHKHDFQDYSDQTSKLFHYKYLKSKNAITVTEIDSQLASVLIAKIYGIKPTLGRSNTHRHQCATFAHQMYSEVIADAWLGHHIDGHYFAAPESSASINLLIQVQEAQEKILETANFSVIKNPL